MFETTPEVQFAISAVRQASLLVKQVQAEMVTAALTKDDRSPVTVADFAAQALVGCSARNPHRHLPAHPFGERAVPLLPVLGCDYPPPYPISSRESTARSIRAFNTTGLYRSSSSPATMNSEV